MRTYLIVQHDDGTPTGSRSTSFFIRGILGPDAWSIFMRWLRRLAERFSVAASLVGHPGDRAESETLNPTERQRLPQGRNMAAFPWPFSSACSDRVRHFGIARTH